ncbi:non-ribosomal peptide synthetase [Dapis sp. BLCC M126]|uniref:non-ribosomal peptide synthetase n=1 Tax=Dapis sp. BLCC M126 TaxID=3400189 RepID=UPI003CFB2C97
MITTDIETPPKQNNEDVFVFPVSFAQKRLWFLQQLQPENSAYNESGVFHCRGKLNTIALEQSLNEIIRRHEVLRTYFVIEKGEPVQVILPSLIVKLAVIDLRSISENEKEVQVKQLIKKETEQPFDLTQAPLIRFSLLQLTENEYILISVIHHIVNDGWSSGVFFKEIEALYEAFNNNKPSPLPELSIQYADFTIYQNNYLQGEELEKLLNYWQQQLKNLSVLALPTDKIRPTTETYKGATKTLLLPKELCNAIKTLGKQQGVTLFMTLLAAFKTLLYRYTQQKDIAVGTPIAGRNLAQTESLIGFFVNNLVLRTNLEGNPSFLEFLSQVRQVALGAYAHQDMPFEKLVDILKPERDLGRSPLFQVMFILQNTPLSKIKFSGVKLETIPIEKNVSKYDLTLAMEEISDDESLTLDLERNTGLLDRNKWGMIAAFEYNTDLFDAETIDRMAEHFQTLLSGIVANPNRPISELPLLTEAEHHKLLVEWNNTAIEYPKDKCIHQLFEEQVEKSPDAVAVEFEGEKLTYQQLNQKANKLAHYLQTLGVGVDVKVGICVERSLETVVGLLGILKAGAAYIPIDPNYPKERIELVLSDSQASVLLTQKHLADTLPENQANVLCLDSEEILTNQSSENPVSNIASENLAYLIYTSGSTGRPKGVQIRHRTVVNFLLSMQQQPGMTKDDVLLAVTTISFDIAGLEIYLPLITGAKVVLVSRATATDGIELAKQISLSNATIMQGTPATWQLLLASGWQLSQNLKILCGGEALPTDLAQQLLNKSNSVWNLYGPTETTIWSAVSQVEVSQLEKTSIPIGHPIANTQLYILDSNNQPVPRGVPGELHIGGAGLARGYLNRPELTAEKFIIWKESGGRDVACNVRTELEGNKLYKTGDLARYLPDGKIEYLGRIDNQVKLRGFRIEIGEIESVLSNHPQVQQTVVICREDIPGNKQLVAYLITSAPELNTTELRPYLESKLPEYMIPSAFVLLETLPLTPNGKIDRKALPAPDIDSTRSHEYVAPQTETEKQIATVLQEVLKLEKVSIYDNFFELGANSLMLVKVNSNLREILSIELPLVDMFSYPNIKALSQHLSNKIETPEFSPEVAQLERKQVKDSLRKRRKLRQKN